MRLDKGSELVRFKFSCENQTKGEPNEKYQHAPKSLSKNGGGVFTNSLNWEA